MAGYSTHVSEPVQAVLECWAVFGGDELVCPIHPKPVQKAIDRGTLMATA